MRNWLLIGFLVPFILLSTGCSAPAPFRVMSFNVRYDNANDGVNRWELRREQVVEAIRSQGPDILGLQEVLASQADELRAALPEYGFVGVGRDDGAFRGEFVPIFFSKERFTLVDTGHFWLSPEPDQPGSKGWDAALPRMATWARLRCNDAPLCEIHVVNVHFDHEGRLARRESAQLLRRMVESIGGRPTIVTGDFNCVPGSEPYRILTEDRQNLAEMNDPHASGPYAMAGTYHGFKGEASGRVDWILLNRRFEALEVAIDQRKLDGRWPSDHFPVVAQVRVVSGARSGYS